MLKRWRPQRGQALVEMALMFPVVFALALGIFEMGLAFNSYLTLTAAAREGARAGAIYLYDPSFSQAQHDQNRESRTGTSNPYADDIRDTVFNSLGIMRKSDRFFEKDYDVIVTYTPAAGTSLTRKGDMLGVSVTYRYQFFTPLIADRWITMTAQASARME